MSLSASCRTHRVPLLAVLVPLALLVGPGPPAQGQGRGDRSGEPPAVIVAPVRAATVADRVEALGTARADESVDVTTDVTEKVVEIRFEDGQEVATGDVLVVLDQQEERADLAAARAVQEEARLAFTRIETLQSEQVAAMSELDARRAALQSAEAQIEVVRSRMAARTIRAPFDGVVGLRNVSVGALVRPGDVITTLDALDPMKIDFTVPTAHLEALRPGMAIEARSAALSGRVFEGRVTSVGTQADPVTRSVTVRAVVPNPEHALKPGLLLTVAIDKNARESLVVPEEAVVPRGSGHHVLVVSEEGEVARRQVRLGARRAGEVEIREGLEAGERVVTHGAVQVRPGQTVRIRAVQDEGRSLAEILDDRERP